MSTPGGPSSKRPLRLGTRGSALALAQARLVATELEGAVPEVEIVPIRTAGDELRRGFGGQRPPAEDKSRFVREIEWALLDEEIDLAVHSAKDVPGELPEGLAIVGVPERGQAADALCGAATLEELPVGTVVGTASLRRRAQLLARRPDLEVRDLRGNVDTRLRRLAGGDYAALVLAAAGLKRLGRDGAALLPTDIVTPAPGQGCLALEGRRDDRRVARIAEHVTHRESLLTLTAERALVAALGASCRTPVAAHAVISDGALSVSAFAGLPDGSTWIRDALDGPADEPAELGRAVAERLVAAGADELLATAERWDLGARS